MKIIRSCLTLALFPLSLATAQTPTWTQVGTASVIDLAANANGAMWAVQYDRTTTRDKPVLKWNGSQFVAQPHAAMRIAVDPLGNPWTVSSTGVLSNLPSNATQWTVASLKAADVAVGPNGSVWAIGLDQGIHRLVNGTWQRVNGTAVRLAVDPQGNAWVVKTGGGIWRFDGSAFQLVAGSARDIAIAPDGSVFIVGRNRVADGFEILRWNGNSWTPMKGVGGVAIAAGQKLYVSVLRSTGIHVYATDYRSAPAVAATTGSPPSGQVVIVPTPTAVLIEQAPVAPPAPAGNTTPLDIRGGQVVASMQPIPGTLICPIIEQPMRVRLGCALVGEKALFLAKAPSSTCNAGEFFDPQNGGECWTCPVGYTRNVSPVGNKDACWKPIGETLAKATQTGNLGCQPGFQNDPTYGCYQCPAGYNRTLDAVTWSTACSKSIFGPFSFATISGKPTLACAAPSFFDPINGGTCWTCPADHRRTLNRVDSDGACAKTYETQYSVATQKGGCSAMPTRVGYGVPFRDNRNGGECWVCPVPLMRSSAPVDLTDSGARAACTAGGNTNRIVWQSPQYPQPGTYAFMPGLIQMAFSNPKAVDTFVSERAKGDANRKRAIWASMIADPASSAEVKALLFTSLLATAKAPNPSPQARLSLAAFERYARARRIFVAEEAKRMYEAWQGVDGYNQWEAARAALGAGGLLGISSEVLGTKGADYESYAWSGANPDSAGLEFVVASAAYANVAPSLVGTTLNTNDTNPFETADYVSVVFDALDKGLEIIESVGTQVMANATSFSRLASGKILSAVAGSSGAAIGLTLVSSAIDLGLTTAAYVEKEQQHDAYDKIVAEAAAPLSVKSLLESGDDNDRRSLLLYWSLATSPYSANAKLSQGRISGDALCQVDEWSKLQCAEAKNIVTAAARAAGY